MKKDVAAGGDSEDPMFMTRGGNCASCSKGLGKISGYRADHVTHDGFPFKDPTKRMMKSGMGFNKIFNESHIDRY